MTIRNQVGKAGKLLVVALAQSVSVSVAEPGRAGADPAPADGVSAAAPAADRGLPVFGDAFDSVGTFAENWVAKNCTPGDGVVRIPHCGSLCMRRPTPLEFVAELDVTATVAKGHERRGQHWGGFSIDGFHFEVQPNGFGFCVWRLPEDRRSSGKYAQIPDFEPGRSVRLRLVRKKVPGGVRYDFRINGVPAGDFIAAEPKPTRDANGVETYAPLCIGAMYADIVVDNFLLSTVRHGDESPNLIFNSGFEHGEDGVPTYYGLLGGFNFNERPASDYESRYLTRFSLDTAERHSGRASLRVLVNAVSRSISVAPWQTGTVKGQAGVFSVWMKASTNGLPVEISFSPKGADGRKVVKVTTEWARYEVTRTELAGKGIYTPVRINPVNPREQDAVLWLDDLQAEIVALPPEGKFDPAQTYATPYQPSELDRDRFGAKPAPEPPAVLVAKKLPPGVKPTADLDAWKREAFAVTDFWTDSKPARLPTAAYLACDDDHLYLGFRNFRENPASLTREHRPQDTMMLCTCDGLELFFKPDPDGGCYHFMTTANGDRFDSYANCITWNGAWTTVARENQAEGAVDFLVTIPLADFAANGCSGRWRVNLCRNEVSQPGAEMHASTAKHRKVNYKLEDTWSFLELPAEVTAKWSGRAVKSAAAGADAVLGRLDFYMDEPFAQWRVCGADGKVTIVQKPLAEIPLGTNLVEFSAHGKTYSDTVVRLPYRKGATQVNRWARCVVKDGEKVLFTAPAICVAGANWLGWKPGARTFETMMDILEAGGFRQTLALIACRDRELSEARAMLDAVRAHKFLYANWCDYGMPLWENYPADRPKDSRIKVKPAEMVAHFRPYEDLFLTNLVIDEPELSMTSDWTRSWLEYMKSFYPYHPVQMNSTVMGVPSKFADLKTDILMLDDYLTNQENRTVDSVVRQVDVMQAVPGGKPCWFFIVANNSSLHYKLPSYAEQIAQSWGCICAGCSGLAWYVELPVTMGSWRAMKQVNAEAQALKDVILSEELCDAAKADRPKSKLRHLTRTLNGDWYVLSCNLDAAPLDKVTFTLPKDAPQDGMVEVLHEDRTLPLRGGVFTDGYPAHARHLYRIR
ncbi:MAG: hypothetical protein ACI4RD_06755 [Kiritimatiellia bacterium]